MPGNYKHVIVDFTKSNPYPRASDFLQWIQSLTGADLSSLIVVARHNQRADLQPVAAAIRQVKWIDDLSLFHLHLAVPVVKQELASILQAAPQDTVLVTSYNGAVLAEIQRLNYPNVEAQSLGKFKPGPGQLPPRAISPSQFLVDATTFTRLSPPTAKPYWRFDGFIARNEAEALLIRALHRRGAVDGRHAVSMPNLKPAMAELDGRFLGSGYANGTGGMMGVLAAGVHFDGLLEAAANYNGTAYYWLAVRALQQLSVPDAAGSPSKTDVEPPTVLAKAASASTAASAESASVPVRYVNDTSVVVQRTPDRSPHKSQRMQDALMKSGYGPRTKQRIPMLDRIGEILKSEEKHTLTEILDLARDCMIQTSIDAPDRPAIVAAIGAVRKMLRELLPASKALKDASKNALAVGFRAGPTVVAEHEIDWRMRTEAHLLLKLITVFPEPIEAEHDVENIVGAMYHVRTGPERRELKREVEAMVGYLLDQGLVHEELVNGRQILVLGPAKSSEQAAEGSQLRIAQGG